MKRKFGLMAVAFVVAVSGVFAGKASPKTVYVSLTNCSTTIPTCIGSGMNCGYVQGVCNSIIQKTAQ